MCTQATHDHARDNDWSSLVNHRPWRDAGLELAECPTCKSTLAREVEFADEEATKPLEFVAVSTDTLRRTLFAQEGA